MIDHNYKLDGKTDKWLQSTLKNEFSFIQKRMNNGSQYIFEFNQIRKYLFDIGLLDKAIIKQNNNNICKFSEKTETETKTNLIDAHEWSPKVKNIINIDTSLLDA